MGVTASGGGPYGGVPATIPGVIQVAEFDLGGEGVGYSDSTAGNIQGVRTSQTCAQELVVCVLP